MDHRHTFEGGVRGTQFWRWAVDREVRARAARRVNPLGHSGSAPSLSIPEHEQEPVCDHGLIFPQLHDIHRQQARAKGAVRLPPVQPNASGKEGSPWWPGSSPGGLDVESAVTVASSAAVTSLLGSAVPPSGVAPPNGPYDAYSPGPPRAPSTVPVPDALPARVLRSPFREAEARVAHERQRQPRVRHAAPSSPLVH
mmetsp:Transcript_56781/g.157172  ORF Transcript_56781/g.157172 Transcript_56781/m.157172 type:complete len:197 (+) Transcript_56781:99-689(+)